MTDHLTRAMPADHPPALALDPDEAEAVNMALQRLKDPTDDDRTAGLAAILRSMHVRSARIALMARIALEEMQARRHARKRNADAQGGEKDGPGPYRPNR